MLDFTLTMLRARQEERVAAAGVIAALFCDDLPEAVRRLENVRDAAREYQGTLPPRQGSTQRRTARNVAAWADDMLPPVRQLARLEAARA